jgi:hypothetical protein
VADTAARRPGTGAWVAEGPDLDKLFPSSDLRTIDNGITDEMSIKPVRFGLSLELVSIGSNESGVVTYLLLDRVSFLLNGLYRGLHVDNSLHLSCSICRGSDRLSLCSGGSTARSLNLITEPGSSSSVAVVVNGCDANTAHWGLEFDERMCMVVFVAGVRLAALAKVCVVAHCALEADALNVRQILTVLAERAIAVDAVVPG